MGRIGKEIAHAGKYAHAMATVSVRVEATELLQGLLRANTVNPPGNETLAAELVRAYLEDAGVECELFRTAFEACKGERGYAAAALEILEERAEWRCGDCGTAVAPGGPLRCAACDGRPRLCAGGELILQRVELEVSDV